MGVNHSTQGAETVNAINNLALDPREISVGVFAPSSFYPFYEHHPHYWGLSPGEDQSLAGLAMALEQSIVMGVALV